MVDAGEAQKYWMNVIELPEAYQPQGKAWGEGKVFVAPNALED